MPKSRVDELCISNPYIRKSISKTLLTPCRQVGLSRKRKSSNNLNQSLPQIESRDDQSIEELPIVTPTIATELEENNHNVSKAPTEKRRKKVVRCLEMNEDGNIENNNQLQEKIEINKNQAIENNLEVPDCQKKAPVQTRRKQKSSRKPRKTSKVEKSRVDQDKETKQLETVKVDRNETRTPTLFDEDEDFVEEDKTKMQRIKDIKEKGKSYDRQLLEKSNNNGLEVTVQLERIDSDPPLRVYTNKNLKTADKHSEEYRKNIDTDDEDFHIKKKKKPSDSLSKNFDDTEVLSPKNCRISANRKQVSPEIPKLEPISPVKKQKKINRSLSLKKTHSDEQNSFDLSDEFLDENCPPPPLLQIDPGKIEELEREIMKKREILEQLQQTEIYKNLHNVKELKQLTDVWKTGCITALNDLLPRLKPYAEIDMATLLNKLTVPEHLIKLSPTGELI